MGLFNEGLTNGANRFQNSTIKCALMTASYTPDVDSNGWASISGNELGTTGTNYTAGGETLSGKGQTIDDTNDVVHLTASDVNFATLDNGSVRYAVIYDETNDILLRWLDFTTTRTLNGGDVDVRFTNSRVLTTQAQ